MRFIGGKNLLLNDINNAIKQISSNAKSVIDIFSGSGVVSENLKSQGYDVFCNDQMYFAYVLVRGTVCLTKRPSFKNLGIKNPISYLNTMDTEKPLFEEEKLFIYNNYSPNGNCERKYFSMKNAKKIDIIRLTIEQWKEENRLTEDEYFYLLACLIAAVPYVSNIAGVYAAYLKDWDPRALKDLTLKDLKITPSRNKAKAFNLKANEALKQIEADVLYSDSPYNSREYLPNYHILETIARYDYPESHGVTGMRDYKEQKSDFCNSKRVAIAFESMIRAAKVKAVIISYNNEGLIDQQSLANICQKYAIKDTFTLKEIPYRRYKSKIPNNRQGLAEQLYCFQKKGKFYTKSPLNYIGGKYKLLPQIMELFPSEIGTMVDLFCGGGDVTANVLAERIFANDINNFVIGIFQKLQELKAGEAIAQIDKLIKEYQLSKTNKSGYEALRKHYNESIEKNPIELFTLVCYSFNHQFRFNSAHEFNNPFGKDRSCFNEAMRQNLIEFHRDIKNVHFSTKNFKNYNLSFLKKGDFLYADPPYLITTGSYNDGKRGFEGWTKKDDLALFSLLDGLNKKGVKFALSNVLTHKGQENEGLKEWARAYNIHYLNYGYGNSNYHGKNTDKQTVEVLITNY